MDRVLQERQRARWAVNRAVEQFKLPRVSTRWCVECGERRAQQYDHVHGYDVEHRLAVEPVCIRCHRKRTGDRGERMRILFTGHSAAEVIAKYQTWQRRQEPPM